MTKEGALVTQVVPGSIAEELGIEPGDRIQKINGQALEDLIDYQFMTADEELEIELIKADGEEWLLEVEKELPEDLGLEFAQATFDGIKRCGNNCVFCFVDQMPPGMRETLYVKDDDYRLSFLYGNFITFTNVSAKNLERIIRLRLSPLYVSVHTTNPALRQLMLNSPRAGEIMSQLTRLAEAGIELHTQVVTCPGLNDGAELTRTIQDLGNLYPAVQSIAIVPVGLTNYRQQLASLRVFSSAEAGQVILQIDAHQQEFSKRYQRRLVYASDEFYMLAGQPLPPTAYYEDFPQTENGVGLARLFWDSLQAEIPKLGDRIPNPTKLLLVTGKSAGKLLQKLANQLNQIANLQVEVLSVTNHYFGEQVTVAGLLTSQDLLKGIAGLKAELEPNTQIILPSVMFKADEAVFLDGVTLQEFRSQIKNPVKLVDLSRQATGLIELILEQEPAL